ncbi:hypothetical protein M0804_015180 [Polistes exclamans]|nr:hypothetical protein M0804_015180 [Polistes exclamans]
MFVKKQLGKAKNNKSEPTGKGKSESKQKDKPFKYKYHRCRKIGHKAADGTASKKEDSNNVNTADEIGSVLGMKLDKSQLKFDYETSLKGNMTETLFPKNSTRNSKSLEIIPSDVMGPTRIESNGQARYVLTFIDDYSQWCTIYLLKRKDQVFTFNTFNPAHVFEVRMVSRLEIIRCFFV